MNCPICNSDMLDDDNKNILLFLFDFFRENANPVRPFTSLCNLAKNTLGVGKRIYMDFSGQSQVDEYLYCPVCKIYFAQCPNCRILNRIKKPMSIYEKIRCHNCSHIFYYHPPAEDGDDHEPMYRYL